MNKTNAYIKALLFGTLLVISILPGYLAENDVPVPENTVVYQDHDVFVSHQLPINFSMVLIDAAGAYINHNISARMDDDSFLSITVKDNAFFQINATGSLDLRNNVTMIFEGNSSLIINGGLLNVSENATLIVKENAKIMISDMGRLQIYGKYEIACDLFSIKNAQISGLYLNNANQISLKSADLGDFNISKCTQFSAEDSQISNVEISSLSNFRATNTLSEKSISGLLIRNVENFSIEDVNLQMATIDNCTNFTARSMFSANISKLTLSHLNKFVLDGYNASNLTVHANEVSIRNSRIKGNDGELSTLTEAMNFSISESYFERGLTFGASSNVTIVNATIPMIKATENASIEIYGWAASKEVDKDKFEAQNIIVTENASVKIYRWLTVQVVSANNTPLMGATVVIIDTTGKNEVARNVTNSSGVAVFPLYAEKITCVNGSNYDVFQGWYTVKVTYEDYKSNPEAHPAIMNDSITVKFVIEKPAPPPPDNIWIIAGIIVVIIIVLLLTYYFFYMTKKTKEEIVSEPKKEKKEEWRTEVKPKFKEPPKEWSEKKEKEE
ncbi:MAG: carboxypeptidase-like regulatory domain-containing protein [Thermoplasmata archaeon]